MVQERLADIRGEICNGIAIQLEHVYMYIRYMTNVPYMYIIYHNNIFRAQLYRLCGARSGSPQ